MSVIVPVLGDGTHLDACLAALAAQQDVGAIVEIIVVDNGSAPPVLDRWGDACTVIREEAPGSYAARNAGLSIAQGSWLAFTDADCVPRPEWLRAGLEVLLREPDAIVAGDVHTTVSATPSMAERFDEAYAFPIERYVAQGYGVTANLFVSRSLLLELGGFDATLMSGGDRDLCERAGRVGARLVYAFEAVVDHPARITIRELISKQQRVTGGEIVMRLRRGATRSDLVRLGLWRLRPPLRMAVLGPRVESVWLKRIAILGLSWFLSTISASRLFMAAIQLRGRIADPSVGVGGSSNMDGAPRATPDPL